MAAKDLYTSYVKFADDLEKDLAATFGTDAARRLFQRLDRSQLQALQKAASTDPLKRQWLNRLDGGYAAESTRISEVLAGCAASDPSGHEGSGGDWGEAAA